MQSGRMQAGGEACMNDLLASSAMPTAQQYARDWPIFNSTPCCTISLSSPKPSLARYLPSFDLISPGVVGDYLSEVAETRCSYLCRVGRTAKAG